MKLIKRIFSFNIPLVIISVLFATFGMWKYFSEPLPSDVVFGGGMNIVKIKEYAGLHTSPRGVQKIRISNSNGKFYYIDCLALVGVCEDLSMGKRVLISVNLVGLGGDFYWPITAEYDTGRLLSSDQSRRIYEIYREIDMGLYKIWLYFAAAFFGFSVWFGKRSLIKI